MFGLGTWLKIGAAAVVTSTLVVTHSCSYRAGKTAVLDQLKDDRITILKDGRRIDEEVLGADDSGLCRILGGCLPVDGGD